MTRLIDLSERLQRIWDATYATAFVDGFRSSYGILCTMNDRGSPVFDRALENQTERAVAIADEAVRQLASWCDQEMDGRLP